MHRFPAVLVAVRIAIVMLAVCQSSVRGAGDTTDQRRKILSLGALTSAPEVVDASADASSVSDSELKAIYFKGLDWEDRPTRVFAWLGIPKDHSEKVPGMVLVHGGGGTAFKDWVKEWTDRGFAAIAIATEGQTDVKVPDSSKWGFSWHKHEFPGPARIGIYEDTNKPVENQWMYHAVADTILANSLLRSLPGVDANKVGLMGISWGAVIANTVMGVDPRFLFAIPTYGCGRMAGVDNYFGKLLTSNEDYRSIWDPILFLKQAEMPSLWLSSPTDEHFSLESLSACARETPGARMLALIPGFKHSNPAAVARGESYAFAESIVKNGKPWCCQVDVSSDGTAATATFQSDKNLEQAMLVSTVDTGFTGRRNWIQTPAELRRNGDLWVVTAPLPAKTTAWFINVLSGNLTASSDFQSRGAENPN